jgi:hypothetical protein
LVVALNAVAVNQNEQQLFFMWLLLQVLPQLYEESPVSEVFMLHTIKAK